MMSDTPIWDAIVAEQEAKEAHRRNIAPTLTKAVQLREKDERREVAKLRNPSRGYLGEPMGHGDVPIQHG